MGGTGVFRQQKELDSEFSLCLIVLIGAGRQGTQFRSTCCPSVAPLNVARYIPGDGGQQPY